MSDVTALSVPPAGWYPDRSEVNVLRWWDGQQWTDQTQSTAPAAAAFEQPVSAGAFGFVPPEPSPLTQDTVAQVAQSSVIRASIVSPGWYPDNADQSLQRWWDGTSWTAHTAPTIPMQPGFGGYPEAKTSPAAPTAPAVNTLATRGMIYSLIGLVLNPLFIMSIGGFVNGVRALRRAPSFSLPNARRGQAIAAIVIGVTATAFSVLTIVSAVLVYTEAHGSTLPVTATFVNDNGTYTWTAPPMLDETVETVDGPPPAITLMKKQIAQDLTDHGTTVTAVDCPSSASTGARAMFVCTVTMSDGRTAPIGVAVDATGGTWSFGYGAFSSDDGTGYDGSPAAGDTVDQNDSDPAQS